MALPFGVDISKWQASQDGLKRFDFGKMMDAQIELLRKFHDLPAGKAQFRAEGQEIIMSIEDTDLEKEPV